MVSDMGIINNRYYISINYTKPWSVPRRRKV